MPPASKAAINLAGNDARVESNRWIQPGVSLTWDQMQRKTKRWRLRDNWHSTIHRQLKPWHNLQCVFLNESAQIEEVARECVYINLCVSLPSLLLLLLTTSGNCHPFRNPLLQSAVPLHHKTELIGIFILVYLKQTAERHTRTVVIILIDFIQKKKKEK